MAGSSTASSYKNHRDVAVAVADFARGRGRSADEIWITSKVDTVRDEGGREGVLRSVADANIGSIFGWGFAPFHGGALQFIDAMGAAAFVKRARELAAAYGARFEPAAVVVQQAARGGRFGA